MKIAYLNRHLVAPATLDAAAAAGLLPHARADEAAIAAQAVCLAARPFPALAGIAEVVAAYQAEIGADAKAQANARRLALPGALAVITGQQAGLLSGPMYTIYKIVTAISLARAAEAQLGVPVVPIFWNATEDHDLSEVASFHYPEREWRADFPATGLAAEALPTFPACRELLDRYLATIADIRHRDAIASLVEPAHERYGAYSSAVVARLFRDSGLVVIEPRLLRPFARDFLARAVTGRQRAREALAEGARQVAAHGHEAAFVADADFGLFHLDEAGHRRRLLERRGQLLVAERWVDDDAVLAAIAETPERFSTAAWLRPVLQSDLLPTLAYIAGPGEWRYHLQLGPLFAQHGVPMPIVHLRNHGTILTGREAKLARQLGLSPDDFFTGPEPHYYRRELPAADQAAFARAADQLDALFADLRRDLAAPVDERRFAGYRERFRRDLDRLRDKTHKDFLKAAGIDNRRLDRFYAAVYPRHTLQERLINVFYFIEAQGPGFIGDLLGLLDPRESRHHLVTTDF